MRTSYQILASMRPRQWVKNVFVLAPLLFASKLGEGSAVLCGLTAFALFCMAAGAVYLLNDIVDRDADAQHPHKKKRPIASGALAVPTALTAVIALSVAAVGAGLVWKPTVGGIVALFLVLNVSYSLKGKQVPVLDVLMISFGFILRVVGGAYAIPVPVSFWILLCTFLLSVYLGLGKRLHELVTLKEGAPLTRPVLKLYNQRVTFAGFCAAGAAAAAAFGAYTLSDRAVANFNTTNLVYTVPLVVLGIARFAMLARDRRRTRPPTESLLSDPLTLGTALVWGVAAMLIIYAPRWLS